MAEYIEQFNEYQKLRRENWDQMAQRNYPTWGGYYHYRLHEIYKQIIPARSTVLEVGCAKGDLLAALNPLVGVGVDLSIEMIKVASSRYPQFKFIANDIHDINLGDQTFDFIVLSEIINDLWDVQLMLQRLRQYCRPETRLVLNFFSQLWKLPFSLARKIGAATPVLLQNWFTKHDVENLLELSGYQPLQAWGEIVCPLNVPLLAPFANRFLAKIFPFRLFDLTNFMIARAVTELPSTLEPTPSVSVIVPARNEAGHISQLTARIPEMGSGTEIIFVEGHSTDGTYVTINQVVAQHPTRKFRVLRQPGHGKGDAVRAGFSAASGDILMILDADITVMPEYLPRFFDALINGRGEFINGVRLVYPMRDEAMRSLNLLGNKFFSWAFSWLLGQKIRDTLCGTKALWAKDYRRIEANRAEFGDFDPFGDFDLLFGAAKLNLKIMEIPIRYDKRIYGTTNTERWRHGLLLLRMVIFASHKIKFR
jgi:2-polyprenyl-3-methyl-5-hydroxy-6-metoxy-1,4-benzoquinol methylase